MKEGDAPEGPERFLTMRLDALEDRVCELEGRVQVIELARAAEAVTQSQLAEVPVEVRELKLEFAKFKGALAVLLFAIPLLTAAVLKLWR